MNRPPSPFDSTPSPSGFAADIQPFHTTRDGDIMFAVSAGDAPRSMNVEAIGEFASRLAVSAVRSAVVTSDQGTTID